MEYEGKSKHDQEKQNKRNYTAKKEVLQKKERRIDIQTCRQTDEEMDRD